MLMRSLQGKGSTEPAYSIFKRLKKETTRVNLIFAMDGHQKSHTDDREQSEHKPDYALKVQLATTKLNINP